MQAEIQGNLNELSEAIRLYKSLSQKGEAEVIAKQVGKLAWNLWQEMKRIAPAKGAVRAERLIALKAGFGVRVRDAVYADVGAKYGALTSIASGRTFLEVKKRGKTVAMATMVNGLNLQALAVKRELAVRESARGFSSWSVPRPPGKYINIIAGGEEGSGVHILRNIESRYGFILSLFQLQTAGEGDKFGELRWYGAKSGGYMDPVTGLSKPNQITVLNRAIATTSNDIYVYVNRKIQENLRQAGLS